MDILQILFFAGLAVFLAVQLYRVLGRPTGRTHEEHVREERERAAAAAASRATRSSAEGFSAIMAGYRSLLGKAATMAAARSGNKHRS